MGITITEGLAEIKTIQKRIEKKHQFILQFVSRQEGLKDPLEKQGGSPSVIAAERQSIRDLEGRVLQIRRSIQEANEHTNIGIGGHDRSIADWLVWRRDVSPKKAELLAKLRAAVNDVREKAKRQGSAVVIGTNQQAEKPSDYIINIDEAELAAEIENLEGVLGQLDGQLSLKNATVTIEV